jgi:hypothetical protein
LIFLELSFDGSKREECPSKEADPADEAMDRRVSKKEHLP